MRTMIAALIALAVLAGVAVPANALSPALWLALSAGYAALVVWMMGLRADIPSKLADTRFVVELGATFMTGVLAAAAAFCAGCPGRPVWERFAPLPALALWMGTLGEGCWQSFAQGGVQGLQLQWDFVCFPSILLVSIVPGALILLMIRQGAPIAPVTTTALAALAAAALGGTALRLFHSQDASAMVLVWQFGSVAVLAALGALTGRRILPWPEPQIAAQLGQRSGARSRR